jgi:hypothetical protein
MSNYSGDGNRISVESRLIESFVNDCVELGIGSSCKESVELILGSKYLDESLDVSVA